jgi:hypothetical protein
MPAGEPEEMLVRLVGPDGSVVDVLRLTVPAVRGRQPEAGLPGADGPASLVDSIAEDWSNEDDRQ